MTRENFRHSFTWGDHAHDRAQDARADLLETIHTGGWCGSCGRWVEDAKIDDGCGCGGTVNITGGGDE